MILDSDIEITKDFEDVFTAINEKILLRFGWYIIDSDWTRQEIYTFYGHPKYRRLHVFKNPKNIFQVSFYGEHEFAKPFNTIKELEELIHAAGSGYTNN